MKIRSKGTNHGEIPKFELDGPQENPESFARERDHAQPHPLPRQTKHNTCARWRARTMHVLFRERIPLFAAKMGWLDNPYRHTVTEAEDFAYPPAGGRGKLITLGIVLPIGLMIYAAHIWFTKEAYWPGQGGTGMTVTGDTALAMSVGCAFLSLFSHFRWFWGLVPHYLIFRIGTTISLLGFLGALGASFYFLFR